MVTDSSVVPEHSTRQEDNLAAKQPLVPAFKQMKLEEEAQKNWDLFYKRNTTHFFKDRHWTGREFEELKACRESESQRLVLLEAGCGVGNCIFPLLEDEGNIFVYACDFSPRAVDFVKNNPLYSRGRCRAFQCDLTRDDLRDNIPEASVDAVTLIFVLSAIHPAKMALAVRNVSTVLKPGGVVLFRDYGLHDHAMRRFKASSKLAENFYVRQDGTRSYFFSKDFLAALFSEAGLLCQANEYVMRETVNKKEGLCVPRVFLQSKFIKTGPPSEPLTTDLGDVTQTCGKSQKRDLPVLHQTKSKAVHGVTARKDPSFITPSNVYKFYNITKTILTYQTVPCVMCVRVFSCIFICAIVMQRQ
ncbi:tRNA N(3)-methylcytidine methyltransferase METTL6 isoform X2 [Entelurus aequoreus]|uniref:tRNA N(3)-methylcytidine methyltransferase METTL6 isoform X2 n=1 Tax=Entelurus aequoreus TaxID=161455 RepID=UPI002B1D9E8E|nr:tRNA N(3)-methylcytidine methyltransferase METTL6 isoform X2 [Entelurus aequoreus]